jgi:hypothetical protein
MREESKGRGGAGLGLEYGVIYGYWRYGKRRRLNIIACRLR